MLANIGVIARNPRDWTLLKNTLTEEFVGTVFSRHLDHPESKVERYELPGICALNFVLKNALGGGGFASLRLDSQAKGFAQLLLSQHIKVPFPNNSSLTEDHEIA